MSGGLTKVTAMPLFKGSTNVQKNSNDGNYSGYTITHFNGKPYSDEELNKLNTKQGTKFRINQDNIVLENVQDIKILPVGAHNGLNVKIQGSCKDIDIQGDSEHKNTFIVCSMGATRNNKNIKLTGGKDVDKFNVSFTDNATIYTGDGADDISAYETKNLTIFNSMPMNTHPDNISDILNLGRNNDNWKMCGPYLRARLKIN